MAREKYRVKDCEIMGIKVYKEQYGKPKYWKTINRFCEYLKCRITYTFNDSPHYYYAGIKAAERIRIRKQSKNSITMSSFTTNR